MKPIVAGLAWVAVMLCLTATQQAQAQSTQSGVPASRRERLSRGVNITLWFRYVDRPTQAFFENYMTDNDLELLHTLGFKHVRLAIHPQYLYRASDPASPDPKVLGYIDKAIDRILARDLAVIIEIHNETIVEGLNLEQDSQAADHFNKFWESLARHFSSRDPEMVFLEVINEPVFDKDTEKWFDIQKRVLATMRSAAPKHTLIATGPHWSSLDGLRKLKPIDDPNVAYTFHFYEPMTFTHQGATWSSPELAVTRGLPYPNTSADCSTTAAALASEKAVAEATNYCKQQWDAAKLDERISVAANWAKQNNAFVFLGEFGVYPKGAPAEDRLRWLQDVRTITEKHGIGWTLWGYEESFGLNRRIDSSGTITIDQGAAKALGLNVK